MSTTTSEMKQDLKYTLDRLYNCRNLEISNLWQRSVFLSVFLILSFTAYGYLAVEFITKMLFDESNCDRKVMYSTVCVFIASVGIVFSVVWILMSKGSKAWYEVYESAISKFEKEYYKTLEIPKDNIMGSMRLEPERKSSNVFSTKAGAFSPSRINVAIGQFILIIWIIISLLHCIYNVVVVKNCVNYTVFVLINLLLPVITIIIVWILIRSKHLRSTFL